MVSTYIIPTPVLYIVPMYRICILVSYRWGLAWHFLCKILPGDFIGYKVTSLSMSKSIMIVAYFQYFLPIGWKQSINTKCPDSPRFEFSQFRLNMVLKSSSESNRWANYLIVQVKWTPIEKNQVSVIKILLHGSAYTQNTSKIVPTRPRGNIMTFFW